MGIFYVLSVVEEYRYKPGAIQGVLNTYRPGCDGFATTLAREQADTGQ